MVEITKEQLLILNKENRARILKYIVLGLIKYKEENKIIVELEEMEKI